MGQDIFTDRNALSFEDNEGTRDTRNSFYVGKRKRSSKGLEIVFDQDQHRDYVTGFHKRKVERRHKAQKQKAEKEKKQRLEDRAEKRAKLREELDLERYETDPESGGEDKPREGKGVRVYKSENALTTVTIAPLILNSDEEADDAREDRSEKEDIKIQNAQRPAATLVTSQQPASHQQSKQGQQKGRQKQSKKGKVHRKGPG